jgi:nicotinate-nucleotide pyrophosphorylase (carboxylating)
MRAEHFNMDQFIEQALFEDLKNEGDHTTLACVPPKAERKARLLVKEDGIIAGIEVAKKVFHKVDPKLKLEVFVNDGDAVKYGDEAFHVSGSARSILTAERLVLNLMQRMSGVATKANRVQSSLKGTKAKVLDTRKTTPGMRYFEKWAVAIGGGTNHRYGLFDMIMIKDNHVDYAGGIPEAIQRVKDYLEAHRLSLKIEVEARNLDEVKSILKAGGVDRIMLDNFTPEGITEESIRAYAETGVDFISMGALTHSVSSLDMSLKALAE